MSTVTAKLNRVAPKAPKAPKAPPAPAAKAPKAKVAKKEAKVPKAARINRVREEAAPKAKVAKKSGGTYQVSIIAKDADGRSRSVSMSGVSARSLDEALISAIPDLNKKAKSRG